VAESAKNTLLLLDFEAEIEKQMEHVMLTTKVLLLIKKIIVLGSGPNRIGQGIEFDYPVHGVLAAQEVL
jgi:hypothetical protein